MLSTTHHRVLTTSTIIVVIIVILLTLYNLRDRTTASTDSLVPFSSEKEVTAEVQKYGATKSSLSPLDTPWKEQDTIGRPIDVASPPAIATTSAVDVVIPSATVAQNEPKRAFVTFLEADTGTNHGDQADGTNSDDEDSYFVGMLYLPSNLIFSNH